MREAGNVGAAEIKEKEAVLSPDAEKAFAEMTTPGSIFTHDTYLEKLFQQQMDQTKPLDVDALKQFMPFEEIIKQLMPDQAKITKLSGVATQQVEKIATVDDLITRLDGLQEQAKTVVNTMPTGNRDVEDEIAKKRAEENRTPQPVVSQDLAEINSAEKEQV